MSTVAFPGLVSYDRVRNLADTHHPLRHLEDLGLLNLEQIDGKGIVIAPNWT